MDPPPGYLLRNRSLHYLSPPGVYAPVPPISTTSNSGVYVSTLRPPPRREPVIVRNNKKAEQIMELVTASGGMDLRECVGLHTRLVNNLKARPMEEVDSSDLDVSNLYIHLVYDSVVEDATSSTERPRKRIRITVEHTMNGRAESRSCV